MDDHRACSDNGTITDVDGSNHDGTGTHPHIVPQYRGVISAVTNGDLLIDTAVYPDFLCGNNGGKSVLKGEATTQFFWGHTDITGPQRRKKKPVEHIHAGISVQAVQKDAAALLLVHQKVAKLPQLEPSLASSS